jgi:hypothetical protein
MFARNEIDLGAPILDTSVSNKKIVSDGMVVAEGY